MPVVIGKARASSPSLCGETHTGSDSAGVLPRCSSLIWNDQTAFLAPCRPFRRVRFAAMRIYEMGSNILQYPDCYTDRPKEIWN